MSRRVVASPIVAQPVIAHQTDRFRAFRRTDGVIAIADTTRPLGDWTILTAGDVPAAELALKRLAAGAVT